MNTLYRSFSIALLLAILLLMAVSASAENDVDSRAPFGLTWGTSSQEVRNLGVQLTASSGQSDFASFGATNLSKVVSDTEKVFLFFGYNDKLWRIAALGRSVGPDPTGSQVVARYRELATILSDRYGRGIETDIRDHELWKGPNQYVMSLKEGRASLYTTFHSAHADVELSVRAADSDTAYYLILFQSRDGSRQFEADKKLLEKDAL